MFRKIKRHLRNKHEARLTEEARQRMVDRSLTAKTIEVKAPCWTPWHEHMLDIIEVDTPEGYAQYFIQLQTDWTGKKIWIDAAQGGTYDQLNPFTFYRAPANRDTVNQELDKILDSIIASHLIEGLNDDNE
jgi:hypothetical protein